MPIKKVKRPSLGKCRKEAPQLICHEFKETEASFQGFRILKMGRSGFVCYMVSNKIEPKEEKNKILKLLGMMIHLQEKNSLLTHFPN